MTQNKATTLEPFLVVSNGKKAVDFYISAFGAREIKRHARPGEKLYSKIAIEGAEFWVGDEEPEYDNLSPGPEGNNALRIILTTKNADHLFEQAIKYGATQICPMTTEDFWRIGKLRDPFGHVWEIGYVL